VTQVFITTGCVMHEAVLGVTEMSHVWVWHKYVSLLGVTQVPYSWV